MGLNGLWLTFELAEHQPVYIVLGDAVISMIHSKDDMIDQLT